MRECGQGWTDTQVVMSLIMLNLVGGECVDDLEHLEADEGFGRLLERCEVHGLSRRVRREMKKRWRKARTRSVVSPSVARRYLSALYCYKHFPAYQPYNVYWAEQGLMLHSEFRDGNVPALLSATESIEGSTELSSLRGDEGSYPLRQRRI